MEKPPLKQQILMDALEIWPTGALGCSDFPGAEASRNAETSTRARTKVLNRAQAATSIPIHLQCLLNKLQ